MFTIVTTYFYFCGPEYHPFHARECRFLYGQLHLWPLLEQRKRSDNTDKVKRQETHLSFIEMSQVASGYLLILAYKTSNSVRKNQHIENLILLFYNGTPTLHDECGSFL